MAQSVRFGKEDIGGELLPILTSGLYRDRLDTLREYIQNAIDADCTSIVLTITPTDIVIRDDGSGMDLAAARNAIRLGVSEKNPLENVGFRGIGIYSAFNICNSLTLYTRTRDGTQAYVLSFDFGRMREALLVEAEKRKRNEPPSLSLESLLQESVQIDVSDAPATLQHGTMAFLSGILPDAAPELMSFDRVAGYLSNVVPLPFRNDFRFAQELEARFAREDYRVVSVSLTVNDRREELFRPYHNGMFSRGGRYGPTFYDLVSDGERFGFAWVCVNDDRKVLSDHELRGILIKKLGFSIGDRGFLEKYFSRNIFNRRISGELIVQHPQMVPNAARNDFEHNSTRQQFFQKVVPKFTVAVSNWADVLQDESKAREVLVTHYPTLLGISESLPSIQDDKDRLLLLNVQLTDIKRELHVHAKVLQRIEPIMWSEANGLLRETQDTVTGALTERKKTQRRLETRVARAARSGSAGPVSSPLAPSSPKTVVEVLQGFGLLDEADTGRVLRWLDDEAIRPNVTDGTYADIVAGLQDFLEEAP